MVAPLATAAALGQKARVAVLQPFLRHAARGAVPKLRTASYEDACSKLDEAVALVDTLGCEVVLKEVVPLRTVHHKYLFGTGKAAELSGIVSAANADAVFVNAPLSGAQQKGLGEKWDGMTVLDRFRVILDIFADRARTTEAKLQVELAGLKYEAAHLVQGGGAGKGRDSGYDRQRGGLGAVGGSGEKALETRRRMLRDRTAEVNRLLKDVERRRGFQRGARNRRLEPTVALVGYTNVGKSSLLNQLALSRHSVGKVGSGGGGGGEENGWENGGGGYDSRGSSGGGGKGMVHARNRVFDTLDPTVRSVTLPSRARCVLVDTVGFIQDLPTDLVHSFRATLEEVRRADVLLHVRDASVEPRVYEAQREAVEETLAELGALAVPTLEVWNKIDKEVAVVAPRGRRNGGNDDGREAFAGAEDGGREDEEEADAGVEGDAAVRGDMSLAVEDIRAGRQGAGEVVGPRARSAAAAAVGGEGGRGGGSGDQTRADADIGGDGGSSRTSSPSSDGGGAGGISSSADSQKLPREMGDALEDLNPPEERGPLGNAAIRVSAATGEGLGLLLEKVDALLHLDVDSRRFAPKPVDRYRYVRVLPGQSR